MDVGDPDAVQPLDHLLRAVPVLALELAVGALPAVHHHAPAREEVKVDAGNIAVLGGDGRARAQEDQLQVAGAQLLDQGCKR